MSRVVVTLRVIPKCVRRKEKSHVRPLIICRLYVSIDFNAPWMIRWYYVRHRSHFPQRSLEPKGHTDTYTRKHGKLSIAISLTFCDYGSNVCHWEINCGALYVYSREVRNIPAKSDSFVNLPCSTNKRILQSWGSNLRLSVEPVQLPAPRMFSR